MRRQWWSLKESGDGWLAAADSLGGAVVIPLLGPPAASAACTAFFPTLSVEKRVDRLTVRVDHGGDGSCVHRREAGAVNEGSSWRLVEVRGADCGGDGGR